MVGERGGPRYRSILFAPYQRHDWLSDIVALGADAVMCDLEDMVPVPQKPEARDAVTELIHDTQQLPIGRLVRINGWGTGHTVADLMAVVRPGLDCVALPKAETRDDVMAIDRIITELEAERGVPAGHIEILPLAETAAGLHFTYEMAMASPRVRRFYGIANATREGDGARALRLRLGRDGAEWIPIGAQVLVAARAAGVSHIMGATAMEPDNLERARRLAELSFTYGANGALCIHPSHIAILNEVYSPTAQEVDHARAILLAIHEALAQGGSSTVVDGETATYSHVRSALDVIELARAAGMPVGELPDIDVPAYKPT